MKEIILEHAEGRLVSHYFQASNDRSKRAFIVLPATGARQRYYRKFAEYAQEEGIDVYTIDYSGIGESLTGHIKNSQASVDTWAQYDIDSIFTHVKTQHPDHKIYIIGQSIGGQIIGLSPRSLEVDGMVFIASQSGYWKLWSFPLNILLLLNWYMLSITATLFGYFPGKKMGIMEDLPKKVALQWASWGKSPNYLFDFYEDKELYHGRIETPLLTYSFSDDTSAPKKSVDWLNEKYSKCESTHKHFHPKDIGLNSIKHFGFFRRKCMPLWKDLFEEIKKW